MNASGDPITEGEFQSALQALREDIRAVGTVLGDMRERLASIEATCKAAKCVRGRQSSEMEAIRSDVSKLKNSESFRKGMERILIAGIGLGAGLLASIVTYVLGRAFG